MTQPTILLRTSWQTLSVGDVSHTPGMIALLERHYPEARIVLWPRDVSNGVREMLAANFPRLEIAEGVLDAWGMPDSLALREAWKQADIFLHGSGPASLFLMEAYRWKMITGKPFGFFGVTTEWPSSEQVDRLEEAAFILTRETASLEYLRQAELANPVMAFCPDAAFACNLRDDEKAAAYLQEEGLEEGKFLCVLPRLRYTPRHKIHNRPPTAEDLRKETISREYAEIDHAKLRDVMIHAVRDLGMKVLVCPEMAYQVEIMDEYLVDVLPEDVKASVRVRRRHWIPDEAAGVYACACAMVSLECHSPILGLRQGVPMLYLRQPTDTIKGQMFRDIGLGDWVCEIDEVTGGDIVEKLRGQLTDPEGTLRTIVAALERVDALQGEGVAQIRAITERAPEPKDQGSPMTGSEMMMERDFAARERMDLPLGISSWAIPR